MNPDIKNYQGQTPLMIAAKNGDKHIVKALIEGGAHSYIQNLKDLTARSYAEQPHNPEIINLLAKQLSR